ncbi:unnamed protein product [Brassica napus]|uniref:(rape) hypothetical protein n=1 Tax=Brassica napus TaxID=3708 RepID=A0A816L825_BRANA|nr:unnamed protein product [Brassica napus]
MQQSLENPVCLMRLSGMFYIQKQVEGILNLPFIEKYLLAATRITA